MGIMPIRKNIPYMFSCMCQKCGSMCHYEIIMTANCLSIFFIPLFKWGRQYYVRTSCCESLYLLDKKVGDAIAHGEDVMIQDIDLMPINENYQAIKRCSVCGYEYADDFEFCPKCGNKLK